MRKPSALFTIALTLATIILALVALVPAAQAQRVTFTYKPPGSIVTWTVPATGLYQITAYGAQGGNSFSHAGTGGFGAEIGGDFTLTAGEVLKIAVGGAGGPGLHGDSAGGGGGSFVVDSSNTPLIIAGGGGGLRNSGTGGKTGLMGDNGAPGGAGGTNFLGGSTDGTFFGGAGGEGFLGSGEDGSDAVFARGGGSFPGLTGGFVGGGLVAAVVVELAGLPVLLAAAVAEPDFWPRSIV